MGERVIYLCNTDLEMAKKKFSNAVQDDDLRKKKGCARQQQGQKTDISILSRVCMVY